MLKKSYLVYYLLTITPTNILGFLDTYKYDDIWADKKKGEHKYKCILVKNKIYTNIYICMCICK